MYVGDVEKGEYVGRCTILGPDEEIRADIGTCGSYIHGRPHMEVDWEKMGEHMPEGYATKLEVGYVDRLVRCENCYYGDVQHAKCNLFELLNMVLSDRFDLNPNIDPKGCCNANIPRTWKEKLMNWKRGLPMSPCAGSICPGIFYAPDEEITYLK